MNLNWSFRLPTTEEVAAATEQGLNVLGEGVNWLGEEVDELGQNAKQGGLYILNKAEEKIEVAKNEFKKALPIVNKIHGNDSFTTTSTPPSTYSENSEEKHEYETSMNSIKSNGSYRDTATPTIVVYPSENGSVRFGAVSDATLGAGNNSEDAFRQDLSIGPNRRVLLNPKDRLYSNMIQTVEVPNLSVPQRKYLGSEANLGTSYNDKYVEERDDSNDWIGDAGRDLTQLEKDNMSRRKSRSSDLHSYRLERGKDSIYGTTYGDGFILEDDNHLLSGYGDASDGDRSVRRATLGPLKEAYQGLVASLVADHTNTDEIQEAKKYINSELKRHDEEGTYEYLKKTVDPDQYEYYREGEDGQLYRRDGNAGGVEVSQQEIPPGTLVFSYQGVDKKGKPLGKELLMDESKNLVDFTWKPLNHPELIIHKGNEIINKADVYPPNSFRAFGNAGRPITVGSYEVFKNKDQREEYRKNVGEGWVKVLQGGSEFANDLQDIVISPQDRPQVYIADQRANTRSWINFSWVVKEAWDRLPDEKKEEILSIFGKKKRE